MGAVAQGKELPKLKYSGFLQGGRVILQEEGVRGLYKGVTASLMREGFYSGLRLGLYDHTKDLLGGGSDPSQTPLHIKLLAGGITGSVGSAIATPTDLVKVRMQSEGALDPNQKPRYKNTFAAFKDIYRTEHIRGLWRGVGPTVQRAALVTASQIPSYDHMKHTILNHGLMDEGVKLHIVCSMFAGLVAATVTSPVDVIKTRMMNQDTNAANRGNIYKNTFDCFRSIVRSEGVAGLYKGWFANWMRIGPHTIVSFITFEQLRKLN